MVFLIMLISGRMCIANLKQSDDIYIYSGGYHQDHGLWVWQLNS